MTSSDVSPILDLQSLTIRELLIELQKVEEQIREAKTFTTVSAPSGDRVLAISDHLVELAELEQKISNELAIRRRALGRQWPDRPAAG